MRLGRGKLNRSRRLDGNSRSSNEFSLDSSLSIIFIFFSNLFTLKSPTLYVCAEATIIFNLFKYESKDSNEQKFPRQMPKRTQT